jgi:pilus assembly protein CpaE
MRIVLADNQQSRHGQLRRIVLGEGLTCEAQDIVGYESLAARLADGNADVVVVTFNGAVDEALAAVRTAHDVCEAPILAAGHNATVSLVREAVRAGAREFLDVDQLQQELAQVVGQIEAERQLPTGRGDLVCCYSPNGGAGVSTIAVNLAARLVEGRPDQVALVDLNSAPSDLALLLDLAPEHTLDDLCERWERMDRKLIARTMNRHASGLQVLAQAGYPAEGGAAGRPVDPMAVGRLAVLLRRNYAAAVVDLDHALGAAELAAMSHASLIALVVRPDVPGLRRARWAVEAAAEAGVPRERFRPVINRWGQAGQVKKAQVEEILGLSVFQTIPEDSRLVNRAVNRGVPLAEVSKVARISRSFSSFARHVQNSARSETG